MLPWLSAACLRGPGDVVVLRVHTDTRSIEPGDLFVALRGERFDANDFLAEALQRGAAAAICTHGASQRAPGLPCIEVPDTHIALAELATAWRARFELPLIAVTGSNGKTTVTQMVAAILAAHRPDGNFLATRGNLNNAIGVPLTLLRLRPEQAAAVVELGMNHPGEIAVLAAMARPTVALVNNAQREHLEFMHSVAQVAQENGSVIAALSTEGVAVLPVDDDYTPLWQGLAGSRRVVTFGLTEAERHYHLGCVAARWEQGAWNVLARGMGVELSYRLSIAGRHNVKNSLAAAACALAAGISPESVTRGLESFQPVKGRSRAQALHIGARSLTLVDDSYNANPDSVRAAIDVLADLPAPRLLVLGDMGEVGADGEQLHAEAGAYAKSRGIEQLWTLGTLAQHCTQGYPGAIHFDSMEGLDAALPAALPHLGSVLVKGSRFMRMERAVDAIVVTAQRPQEPNHVH
ncbi:MAG: UDP-N-acetylmuramoyl-tripeptide--D-alanyl-D-alanine ligase [Rhodoferax sp.]|nr:UDP-N-acetylmuramoyl-tripeptide--D-alanyl-D-alanine ligase [Rhodoferax sp.]